MYLLGAAWRATYAAAAGARASALWRRRRRPPHRVCVPPPPLDHWIDIVGLSWSESVRGAKSQCPRPILQQRHSLHAAHRLQGACLHRLQGLPRRRTTAEVGSGPLYKTGAACVDGQKQRQALTRLPGVAPTTAICGAAPAPVAVLRLLCCAPAAVRRRRRVAAATSAQQPGRRLPAAQRCCPHPRLIDAAAATAQAVVPGLPPELQVAEESALCGLYRSPLLH
jgi:hypothetical protein